MTFIWGSNKETSKNFAWSRYLSFSIFLYNFFHSKHDMFELRKLNLKNLLHHTDTHSSSWVVVVLDELRTSSVPVGTADHEAHVVHLFVPHQALWQVCGSLCGRHHKVSQCSLKSHRGAAGSVSSFTFQFDGMGLAIFGSRGFLSFLLLFLYCLLHYFFLASASSHCWHFSVTLQRHQRTPQEALNQECHT